MKDILLIVGPIIVGVVSSYLTYYFTNPVKAERIDLEIQRGEILEPSAAHARLSRQHDIGSDKKEIL